MKSFLGVLAVLVLVAGGLYGIQSVNAGDKCCAATAAKASADKGEATVEATNATAATATTATSASCCAGKTAAVNAEHAGAQCTYNAKSASVQCTGMAKEEVMTAEATMAKLAHCGIDCRTADASVLSAKLANSHCGSYTQEQWTAMIKSAQALDAKQADAIFASATSEKACAGDACPMKKVALEMKAAQNEEKKESTN